MKISCDFSNSRGRGFSLTTLSCIPLILSLLLVKQFFRLSSQTRRKAKKLKLTTTKINMVIIQLNKRRNSNTLLSSMSVEFSQTKSESKSDKQRQTDTATSLINVTTFVIFLSQGSDFIIKICYNIDNIKRRTICNAGQFLKVTNMIMVNAYLSKISAFQKTTIL